MADRETVARWHRGETGASRANPGGRPWDARSAAAWAAVDWRRSGRPGSLGARACERAEMRGRERARGLAQLAVAARVLEALAAGDSATAAALARDRPRRVRDVLEALLEAGGSREVPA